jgi:ABC-type amino acid transport substrate-binding protein
MRRRFTFDKESMFALCGAVFLIACTPADPDHATDRIRVSHVMRVGVSENRPWIWFEKDQAFGPEAEILKAFAASLGAVVRWTRGAESPLLERLKARHLDAVAGGFTTQTPWKSQLGMTRPYVGRGWLATGRVLLTAPGENGLLLRLDRFLAGAHGRS